LGDATDCIISGFDITCLPDLYLRWDPNSEGTLFTPELGQKFRVRCKNRVDKRDVGNGEWIVYYECIHSGVTNAQSEPDFWGSGCQTPDLSSVWKDGQQVKLGTLVRAWDWHTWNVIFEEKNGGSNMTFGYNETGELQPPWNFNYKDPSNETIDGTVLWKA